jgi:hypothetical protein
MNETIKGTIADHQMDKFAWREYEFEPKKDSTGGVTWHSEFGWISANPLGGTASFVATRYYSNCSVLRTVESIHGFGATREEALDDCRSRAETMALLVAPWLRTPL